MKPWPKHPLIYEINAWVWLDEVSRRVKRPLTLASIPDKEWDHIASLGFDAVWLMGVWERSPEGLRISMKNDGLLADFRRALPDFTHADNVGSPYCVRRYTVDGHLGGPEGLAGARTKLAQRGLRLILDFVPNHVAPDHPWATRHPEYFIQGSREDLSREPASFVDIGGKIYACGRDPYFPAWPDVIQVNAFEKGLRSATIETLSDIAGQCDGVRCDMAMLLLNSIFEKTWTHRAGPRPGNDYWPEIIPAIKKKHPEFRFIAEAYWGLEWELQQQGFDYCYDKRLYDRLEHENAESIRLHLSADLSYQGKLIRFIENHDEPRAAQTFSPQKQRAAAVIVTTLMGARLLHEGQFEGLRVRLPVFLSRRPDEPIDHDLQSFYNRLLSAVNSDTFKEGEWQLCERSGWPDNQSFLNLVAWCWRKDDNRYLIAVNLSEAGVQALVRVPWDELKGKSWKLADLLSGDVFKRDGGEMRERGLYVDLPPWGYHFLQLKPE